MSEPRPAGADREPEGTGKTSRAVHGQHKKERLAWGASQESRREPCHGMQEHWEGQLQQFLKSLQPILTGQGSPGISEASPWEEDTKEFLASFEQVAKACRWPRDQWVARLLPALSGEAEEAFRGLEARDQDNYEKVKAAILRGEALRTERQRQHFRQFCCQEVEDPQRIHSQLQELCHQWLRPERRTKDEILELLILEQFLASLPPELRSWIQARRPESCPQAVALVEDFLRSQQEAKSRTPQGPLKEEPMDFPVAENEPRNASKGPVGGEAEPDVDAKLLANGFQPPGLCPLPSPPEEVGQTEGKEGSRELKETGGLLQIVQQGATQPGQQTMLWQVLQEAGNPTDRDPSDKMSAKRKSYSVEFKKGIVEASRGKNLTAFCKERKLALRMVRKWRAEYENLSQQVDEGNAKKRKCGSGRQPLFPELEDNVCEWIADRRAKALVVRRADIQAFALAMASQLEISPEFKASQHWLDDFLQRYELSLQRSTAPFKPEDAQLIKRALAFKSYIDGIDFSRYQLSNVIAMDETVVFVGQGSETTVDQRGAPSTYVPSAGYESARVTCILAVRLDGTKAPPLIVTKGAKDKLECISDVYVLETEKAWCTQAVIRTWVDLMLPLVLRGGQRGLLVWDSASTHRAKDMKKFLAERGIDQIMIPAGMAAYLQTLDTALSNPFKDHLQAEIHDYLETRRERNQGGNFAKPGLPEVVTWVKNSWDKITGSCVASVLRAAYVDKKCSFKESCVAGHKRLGPVVLEEMEAPEIQAGIQGLESYDDVAEEDDMTVFE